MAADRRKRAHLRFRVRHSRRSDGQGGRRVAGNWVRYERARSAHQDVECFLNRLRLGPQEAQLSVRSVARAVAPDHLEAPFITRSAHCSRAEIAVSFTIIITGRARVEGALSSQ